MPSYSVRDVERVLRLAPQTTRNLVRAGFVKPARGARREYRFSFQDLIVLRAARALIDAKIPPKRIHRSLENLRRELPESMPLSGLSISAVGDHVVVRDGEAQRQVDSGQYLLGLDVSVENGVLHVVEHRQETATPVGSEQDWFSQALALESTAPDEALVYWQRAVDEDPASTAAWINWGRLLHEQGQTSEAADGSGCNTAVQSGSVVRRPRRATRGTHRLSDRSRGGSRARRRALQSRTALRVIRQTAARHSPPWALPSAAGRQ
jgi:DNA-binding transcriptional MerR regulator